MRRWRKCDANTRRYTYPNTKLHAEHVHNNVDRGSRGASEQQHSYGFSNGSLKRKSRWVYGYGRGNVYRFVWKRDRSTSPWSSNARSHCTAHHSVDEFPCEYVGNLF